MFITSMLCDWKTNFPRRNVMWAHIDQAIRQLDGSSHSEVSIGNDEEAHLSKLLSLRQNKDINHELDVGRIF